MKWFFTPLSKALPVVFLQPIMIVVVLAVVVLAPLLFLGWLVSFFFIKKKVRVAGTKFRADLTISKPLHEQYKEFFDAVKNKRPYKGQYTGQN